MTITHKENKMHRKEMILELRRPHFVKDLIHALGEIFETVQQ